MKTKIINNPDTAAGEVLKGNIVALPTETVYGLAADALNPEAVLKIYETKKRPDFNPLIVHVGDISDFEKYAVNIPAEVYAIAEKFSPGPVTYVLPKKDVIPDIVTAGIDTVALRIPSHPLFREVLRKCGCPIAAPSANMFGRISPTTAEDVLKELSGKIDFILDGGRCPIGIESTVVSFEEGNIFILRHGYVTKEDIEKITGRETGEITDAAGKISSPGMLKSHYAPVTPLYFTDNIEYFKNKAGNIGVVDLSLYRSLKEAALNLFADLRKADEKKYEYIVTKRVDNKDLGRAVNDRLAKASSGTVMIENGSVSFLNKK
ncbi:MAG: threonylcarbamoyl-AMP synthase [Bacteroidetes bacterium]|nr:threonylcarbamoyl-AMP synthase [Bacteroidota bacterium]